MESNASLGRGPFIFISILTGLTLLVLVGAHLFIDTDAIFRAPEAGLLEYGAWLFLGLNFTFVLWHSTLMKGLSRTLLAVGITFFLAWFCEGLGVHYGLVFGHYHYTHLFQPQIWAVPLQICLAWEPILYSAYLVTDFLVPTSLDKALPFIRRLIPYLMLSAIGAILTTVWDLMADPLAVTRPWWVWEQGGPYMRDIMGGVPISNYMGWLKLSFACHLIYRLIMDSSPKVVSSPYLKIYGPIMLYLNQLIFGLCMAFVFLKRMDVVLIGLLSMGGIALIALVKVYALHAARAEDHVSDIEQPVTDGIGA